MDLSAQSSDLLGTAQSRLLRSLSRVTAGMTGRQLARVAELPPTSALTALRKLESTGLVASQPMGRALVYRLNRKHVLGPAVDRLLQAPAAVEQLIADVMRELTGRTASASLYGSVARGDAGVESDIDVLIVWTEDTSSQIRAHVATELSERVSEATGNDVEVIDVDIAELRRLVDAGDPLVASWRRDARTLSGPEIHQLIAQAAQ